MIIQKKDITFSFQTKKAVFFDIETTGLSRQKSYICVLGYIRFENASWMLTQVFPESPLEEKQVIEHFLHILSTDTVLYHYNGSSFDIPYINSKCKFYQICYDLSALQSVDLYRMVYPLKSVLGLTSLKQRDVEKIVQYKRTDQYSGKDIPGLYREFTETGNEHVSAKILLHNEEDLLGLLSLLPLYTIYDLFDSQPDGISFFRGDGYLQFHAHCLHIPIELNIYRGDFSISCNGDKLVVEVPTCEDTLKLFFPDWKNYYYLPDEDTAVHKSVGQFVDREHRQKASPSTCYIKRSGVFIPAPDRFTKLPLFSRSRGDSQKYCMMEELLKESGLCSVYVQYVLKYAAP